MLRCMTSAIAGLKANMTGLDVVGNNVSNVNTDSFKSSGVTFRDAMYQQLSAGSANSNNAAGMNPSQIGYGSTASSVSVNTTKGGQNATGNASDVYIDGSGYFVIGDSAKAESGDTFSSVKYTRLGKLGVDSAGYLTDGNGNYVCNVTGTSPNYTYTAIKLDPGSGKAVADIKDVSIGSDGKISYNNGVEVKSDKQITLASFANPGGLEQVGNSYYTASDNAGTPSYITPGTNGTNKLITGALEGSNVDLATEFSNMIIFERGYQANTKIVTVADECLQTLVNMK